MHEFGHRFDHRITQVTGGSNLTFFVYQAECNLVEQGQNLEETRCKGSTEKDIDYAIRDTNGDIVMGSFRDASMPRRGLRGWGSGPYFSTFQQNAADNDSEAAADMFLNWVYRQNSIGGFVDKSWSYTDVYPEDYGDGYGGKPCNTILLDNIEGDGCPQLTKMPGVARWNWMNDKMNIIFANVNW